MATRQVTNKIDQGGKIRATKKFKHFFLKKKEKQKKKRVQGVTLGILSF